MEHITILQAVSILIAVICSVAYLGYFLGKQNGYEEGVVDEYNRRIEEGEEHDRVHDRDNERTG